jgi:hypothetical protein
VVPERLIAQAIRVEPSERPRGVASLLDGTDGNDPSIGLNGDAGGGRCCCGEGHNLAVSSEGTIPCTVGVEAGYSKAVALVARDASVRVASRKQRTVVSEDHFTRDVEDGFARSGHNAIVAERRID